MKYVFQILALVCLILIIVFAISQSAGKLLYFFNDSPIEFILWSIIAYCFVGLIATHGKGW